MRLVDELRPCQFYVHDFFACLRIFFFVKAAFILAILYAFAIALALVNYFLSLWICSILPPLQLQECVSQCKQLASKFYFSFIHNKELCQHSSYCLPLILGAIGHRFQICKKHVHSNEKLLFHVKCF